jgi:hypothetical protein
MQPSHASVLRASEDGDHDENIKMISEVKGNVTCILRMLQCLNVGGDHLENSM